MSSQLTFLKLITKGINNEKRLMNATGESRSAASRKINRLRTHGLITKDQDYNYKLTPRGKEFIQPRTP